MKNKWIRAASAPEPDWSAKHLMQVCGAKTNKNTPPCGLCIIKYIYMCVCANI